MTLLLIIASTRTLLEGPQLVEQIECGGGGDGNAGGVLVQTFQGKSVTNKGLPGFFGPMGVGGELTGID